MSGSYWNVGTKSSVNQTDIEIRAEGGESFGENQTFGVFIPPSVKLFDGSSSTFSKALALFILSASAGAIRIIL